MTLPEGFEPVFRQIDESTRRVEEDRALHTQSGLEFSIWNADTGEYDVPLPRLPLRAAGQIWHQGWDIPTRWAVDATGQAWKNRGHGGPLYLATAEEIVSTAENEHEANKLRVLLGLPVPMPEWAAIAIRAGFTPPDGWTWEGAPPGWRFDPATTPGGRGGRS